VDARQQRGAAIAAGGEVIGQGVSWFVPSQTTQRKRYKVDPFARECSCPDHQETGVTCKHLWAVELVMTTETHADGTTTETRAARVTYSQEWSSYNDAQTHEKDRFQSLLAELCATIPQPPQGKGRPRLPLSDMAFATVYKVYSRFSSRRFASDLRDAEQRGLISRAPHFNSVTNYMSDAEMTPILQNLIAVSALPLKAVETDFAVDSSGFSTCRFDQWFDFKHGKPQQRRARHWLKAHLMVGVQTNVVTSVETSRWNEADGKFFAPLVNDTAQRFAIAEVSADKAYLSRKNVDVVEAVGATPFVPFKSNSVPVLPALLPEWETAWSRMWHQFSLERDTFLRSYHKRSNVETTFSMIKGKFGDSVMSKSETGQTNEVLCKVLAHNVVVVARAIHELGLPDLAISQRDAS
jgi:transposase